MLPKYKYSGALGTSCICVSSVETGDPRYEFTQQKIPVGSRFTVTGLTIDGDGDYQVHLRYAHGPIFQLSPEVFDRCFVSA